MYFGLALFILLANALKIQNKLQKMKNAYQSYLAFLFCIIAHSYHMAYLKNCLYLIIKTKFFPFYINYKQDIELRATKCLSDNLKNHFMQLIIVIIYISIALLCLAMEAFDSISKQHKYTQNEAQIDQLLYFQILDANMNASIIKHYPVMISNVISKIKSLHFARPIKIADCNFGFGGHSRQILKTFPNALIQAYDLDPKVIEYYQQNYQSTLTEEERKRLHITNANFTSITTNKIFDKFDVILADFGFNSYHLQTQRGFSWMKEENLEMRYSPNSKPCSDIVNKGSELEIISILERYGQLKGAKNIAAAIIQKRPINTTKQLKQSILQCFQDDKTRKIAQVFQAFRIATNDQLKDIQRLCSSLTTCLQTNGLFIGVTFHSLERDVIHNFSRENSKHFSKVETQVPSDTEINQNSKSKSAKMLSLRKKL